MCTSNGLVLFLKIFLEKLFDGNTEDLLWPWHPVFTIYCFVPWFSSFMKFLHQMFIYSCISDTILISPLYNLYLHAGAGKRRHSRSCRCWGTLMSTSYHTFWWFYCHLSCTITWIKMFRTKCPRYPDACCLTH